MLTCTARRCRGHLRPLVTAPQRQDIEQMAPSVMPRCRSSPCRPARLGRRRTRQLAASRRTLVTRPRGMRDLFASDMQDVAFVEKTLTKVAQAFSYGEVRTPVIEHLATFTRSLGESSDVVRKEMYSFPVHEGKEEETERYALRPENTAGIVRAAIQRGVGKGRTPERCHYLGPMFRRERPQRGRHRQFSQFGVECFGKGADSLYQDVEVILIADMALKQLGVEKHVKLHINTLGDDHSRQRFNTALQDFLGAHETDLSSDSRARLRRGNALRILDSKSETDQRILRLAEAPTLRQFLSAESSERFDAVVETLTSCGVPLVVDAQLVRGLDYYNDTVFEFVDQTHGGRQSAVVAGGRYDGLFEMLEGPPTPAFGWAAGVDRLVLLRQALRDSSVVVPEPLHVPTVVVISLHDAEPLAGLTLSQELRTKFAALSSFPSGVCVGWTHTSGSVKAEIGKAVGAGASALVLLGGDEVRAGTVNLKLIGHSAEEAQRGKAIPAGDVFVHLLAHLKPEAVAATAATDAE